MRVWPGELDEDRGLVEEAVGSINRMTRGAALTTALAVGRYVEEAFFGGADGASGGRGAPGSKRKSEHASYRALARHPELDMGASTLWACVELGAQMELLGEELGRRLTWSDHKEIMGVRDPRARRRLAAGVVDKAWDRERLRAEVGRVRERQRGSRTGRPPKPAWDKGIGRIRRGLEVAQAGGEGIEVQGDELERMGAEKVRSAIAEVGEQIAALAALKAALEAGLQELGEAP